MIEQFVANLIEDHKYKLMNWFDDNGTSVQIFISKKGKGKDIIKIEYTDNADEEILKQLKGEIRVRVQQVREHVGLDEFERGFK